MREGRKSEWGGERSDGLWNGKLRGGVGSVGEEGVRAVTGGRSTEVPLTLYQPRQPGKRQRRSEQITGDQNVGMQGTPAHTSFGNYIMANLGDGGI